MGFNDFRKFSVWKKGFDLLLVIYEVTRDFPTEEKYGIVSDIRRSANSVVHNIAKGYGRYEKKDKTRFYKISRGSGYEIMSQIMVSEALNYIDKENSQKLIAGYEDVITELDKIIKSVESR